MKKRMVSIAEVQNNLKTLIASLDEATDTLIVEHGGQPIAVILSPVAYEQSLRPEAERDWMMIQQFRARNAGNDPDAIVADVTAELKAERRERREARIRSA